MLFLRAKLLESKFKGFFMIFLLVSSIVIILLPLAPVNAALWSVDPQSEFLQPKWVGYVPGGGEALLTADVLPEIPGEEVFHAGGPVQPSTTPGRVTCMNGRTGNEIWRATIYGIGDTATIQMSDIDNDGRLEIVVALQHPAGIYVLNAEDGSTLWCESGTYSGNPGYILPLGGRIDGSGVIGDTDGDGNKDIFMGVMAYEEQPETGKLLRYEWDPVQQTIVERVRTTVWHPCAGGLSLGDTDNDGTFELYMNERDVYVPDGGWGRGLTSFWANNLTKRWDIYDWGASSNIPMLADVNNDGIVDVVSTNLGVGALVLNSTDGHPLTNDQGTVLYNPYLGLPVHYQSSIYDIDGDDYLELLCADGKEGNYNETQIWDLYNWQLDGIIPNVVCFRGPSIGEVTGDGVMDIIVVTYDRELINNGSVQIYNRDLQLMGSHWGLQHRAIGSVVQDIDRDPDDNSTNELLVLTQGGVIYCFDTQGVSQESLGNPRPRSEIHFFSESRLGASEYVPFERPWPDVGSPTPVPGSLNVSTTLSQLSFSLTHPLSQTMNYTVTTTPDIGSSSGTNVGNGEKTITVSSLAPSTFYNWQVNATDESGHKTTQNYWFITAPYYTNTPPTQSNPLLSGASIQENLVCENQTTADINGDNVTNIYNWYKNGASIANLNLPFDAKPDSEAVYSGTATTRDFSGRGNNGEVFGATWTEGVVGGAYYFDGLDFINVEEQGNSLGGGGTWTQMSLEFWVKSSSSTPFNPFGFGNPLIWKPDRYYPTNINSYRLDLRNNNLEQLEFTWYLSSGSNTYALQYNQTSGVTDWHHVVCTYKSGSGLRIYVDGVQGAINSSSAITGNINATSGPLRIVYGEPSWYKWFPMMQDFKGFLDEIRIYPFELTPQMINQRYLDTKNGSSNSSTIPSSELTVGDQWLCQVTPNDGLADGTTENSDTIGISGMYNEIFADGFESGDFSRWNGTITTTGGSLSVVSSPVHSGSYSGQFDIEAGTGTRRAYCYTNLNSLSELYATAYVYIADGLPLSDGQALWLVQFENSSGSPLGSFGLRGDATGTHWALQFSTWPYALADVSVPAPLEGTWYRLDVFFTHAATGKTLSLQVNGVEVVSLNEDTSTTSPITAARFGIGYWPGASTVSACIDDVSISTQATFFDLTILTADHGTTNPAPGIYQYLEGSEASVQANPEAGYQLSHWIRNGTNVGNANPYEFVMDANYELTAVFVPSSVNWYWGDDTVVNAVAQGDVDGDGEVEIVTGGYYFDGNRNVAQLAVWSSSTLTLENVRIWYWNDHTTINSIAIANVDGDAEIEIVTAGSYFDGTCDEAQLVVWSGASLALETVRVWCWNGGTTINSVAVGNVDGDADVEIVTGGYYYDGARNVAQLAVWSSPSLALENVQVWHWGDDTVINSVAVANINGDTEVEVVTGGYYYDGTRNIAQLAVWSGATLTFENVQVWYWNGATTINSIAVGNVDGDADIEVVTAGSYFDGTCDAAQLAVWSGATLALENVRVWCWGDDTVINSVTVVNVDGDADAEIITGGFYLDGSALACGQLVKWTGSSLAFESVKTWLTGDGAVVTSVTYCSAGVIAGGYYFDGLRDVAQLTIWP